MSDTHLADLDPSQLRERIDQINQRHEENIARLGLSLMGVFPTEENQGPPFIYTIGLTDLRFPEMIILGVSGENAAPILNHIFASYLFSEQTPERGDVLRGFLHDEMELRLGSVDEKWFEEEYLIQALNRQLRVLGRFPTALQIIIPDRENRFPLNSEYDSEYMTPLQRCLAPEEEWDYLPETKIVTATKRDLRELETFLEEKRKS